MNKNKFFTFVGVLAVLAIVVGVTFFAERNTNTIIQNVGNGNSSDTTSDSTDSQSTSTVPVVTNLKDRAWVVFSNYLSEARAHNIEGVKALSYRQSATCADPKQRSDCFALMDDVYNIGTKLNKVDFKNMANDSKQLILSTDPTFFEDDKNYGYRKSFIFFVLENDNLKLLAIDPNQEWLVEKSSVPGAQEAKDKLNVFVRDSDSDGLTDRVEECPAGTSIADLTCVKTDPKNKDTDGDGWWDGVQIYIPKK